MSVEDRLARLEAENAALRRGLTALEDERVIRHLHHNYGYFMDKWLFPEIVDLFAEDVILCFLNGIFRGRAGAQRMYGYAGEGIRGPRDGLLFEHLLMQDVIDVAPDGLTAKGRFHAIMFVSVHDSVKDQYPDWPSQFWEGGIHENEYRKVDGVWKISRFDYRISYQADYASGWASAPDKPLMVRPFEGKFPEFAGGPDELRPMPPQWPQATFPPFHYPHPVTGAPIMEEVNGQKRT
ncbi:nuclear transport factor 2 family protein [Altericroceibacterium endophyticum]|uniref:Nuclear transport factor 2 family protein n=1 Tax=Altericroceibacterium endophyticum TaxID=1808508 RepID=A0A6I4T7D9_9SPHN|nr:nuclear transport factor 2 family protein [Altericroceibacterium endophyticum]MXO67064.1 nuclear transport factor 2 family protein [Altericroceibacterium endophyticum]